MRYWFLAIAAGVAIVTALWQLGSSTDGLTIVRTQLGATPVTLFRPAAGKAAPAVVIAHGFAGSQQLMQPFAVTLARNGFVAVTFDFPGHGRNTTPLPGGLDNHDARSAALLSALDAVVSYAGDLPGVKRRIALLGHSMASDIVVQYGMRQPAIEATVGVSLFAPGVTATRPRNLLVIDGAWEPAMLRDEAYRIVALAAGGPPLEGVTYGSFAEGTARRLALADGVEHIAVLYSRESMREARDWLIAAFGGQASGDFLDARGRWLALLYLGLVALALPLARLLPRVAAAPLGAGLRWRRLLPVAVAPALLTPLLLWQLPTDFLPILLGDYLAVHYAVYGLLTGAGLWMTGHFRAGDAAGGWSWRRLCVAVAATSVYGIVAIGWPLDSFVFSYRPDTTRLALIIALMVGTLPYFVADEWLTRGAAAPTGAYAATKFCFLLSLIFAIGLNLERLFFLAIIVPAILAFFVVYGLFSRWVYRQTNHPAVGACANAAAIAWAIGVTFPLVSR
jgi:hypothetical protein